MYCYLEFKQGQKNKGTRNNFISIVLVYNMRVACAQISSVEQAHIIQLSMDTGSNRSVYHTARLVECLAGLWCVYICLLKYYTLEIQIYITKEHLLIFVTFEITRNNKCTVYSFQEKYQLVCSSILSYILFL